MSTKNTEQFEGQHDGESIEFVFRQHPIVLRKALIFFLVVFTLGSIPIAFWPLELWPFYFVLGGLVVGFLVFMYRFIGWYFSMYIVTNERLIQIKQNGFFDRQVVGIAHSKIQSINYQIRGIQPTLFHFGTIVVQMYTGDLILNYIHHPSKVHKRLTQLIRNISPDSLTDVDSAQGSTV